MNQRLKEMIIRCIILNSDVRIEIHDAEQEYTVNGNPVEVGLFNYLISRNINVQAELVKRERNYEVLTVIPFSQTRKSMTVCYFSKEHQNVIVVVKGAPENVVAMTTYQADSFNDPVEFHGTGKQGATYNKEYVSDLIARSGNKPLTFAFKTISFGEYTQLKKDNYDFETEEGLACLQSGLTLLATFGFADDLRPGAFDAISKLYNGGTNTRIISGDHRDTVIAVARHF
jgi:magnesium-transporting ATPase (P-type)